MMSVFSFGRANLFKVVLVAAAMLLAACLVASVGMEKPAGATFPGTNGKIAYAQGAMNGGGVDDEREIYLMDPDGSNRVKITNNTVLDDNPAWSPDGTKIAFMSQRDGNAEIYVMNSDGSDPTRLTNSPGGDVLPAWSPDGTKIAFSSRRNADASTPNNAEIYVMNSDGSNPTRLTNYPNHDGEPEYSPDGTKIAFSRFINDLNVEIYVMDSDGSNPAPLANSATAQRVPDYSPDGTRIVFFRFQDASGQDDLASYDIYVMNSDGSSPTNLTNTPFPPDNDYKPTWSPDGTKIAFMSNGTNGNSDIYVMNSGGSNPTNITNGDSATHYLNPDWGLLSYDFSGFFQPVDNLDTNGNYIFNKTKPGKTIPIRFSLGGDKGLDIFAKDADGLRYPKSQAIQCDSTATVDGIEETVAVKHGLVYDPVSDRYTYDWGTDSTWSGCRQFVMKLKDGTVHRANFTFK